MVDAHVHYSKIISFDKIMENLRRCFSVSEPFPVHFSIHKSVWMAELNVSLSYMVLQQKAHTLAGSLES